MIKIMIFIEKNIYKNYLQQKIWEIWIKENFPYNQTHIKIKKKGG